MAAFRIVCRELNTQIHPATFYRMIEDGRVGPVLRLGTKILIPRAALEDFLEKCRAGERY